MRDAVRDLDSIPKSRRKVRAYFDADIPASVAERIRKKLRWDVLCAQEQAQLRNRDDEFHYANARKLGRLLFTLDKDFLDDRRFPLRTSPGLYVLCANQNDPDEIFHAVSLAAMMLTDTYRRLPAVYLGTKVLLTLEGQRIRYTTMDSEIHELIAPY